MENIFDIKEDCFTFFLAKFGVVFPGTDFFNILWLFDVASLSHRASLIIKLDLNDSKGFKPLLNSSNLQKINPFSPI